ncbi:YuiB family protein [Microaerobacter geothermalis]|uniref:YuiB family protein n=1 Tax=Microaerobacter geothermalis TaxID=674972 RepID=UPI001F4716A5|nr:YuiB family protein [Microaerobacter geothermalis]MCF6092464.1 YuiB family protein [Microaerobacter geothermalis]
MNVIQLIISIPLFFILAFGVGFILNMLVKTTWLPLIIYAAIVLGLFIKKGSFLTVDVIILSSGLLGALFSGIAIRMLRVRGYRMF